MSDVGRAVRVRRTPVSVYVLFHKEQPDGLFLAESLYDWFRSAERLSLSREPVDLSGAGSSLGSVVGALADALRPKTELETRTEEQALLEALVAIEAAQAQLDAASTP